MNKLFEHVDSQDPVDYSVDNPYHSVKQDGDSFTINKKGSFVRKLVCILLLSQSQKTTMKKQFHSKNALKSKIGNLEKINGVQLFAEDLNSRESSVRKDYQNKLMQKTNKKLLLKNTILLRKDALST